MTPLHITHWQVQADLHAPQRSTADVTAPLTGGGVLQVSFLTQTLARITLVPKDGFKEPHTWSICPEPGQDVPWTGRPRASLSGFARPELTQKQDANGHTVLSTQRLSVGCLLYTSPSPRDRTRSRMPSSA